MLCHTLGEALARGIDLSATLPGFGVISTPLRLGLLSWHRESEVTADPASLLAVNDLGAVKSLLTKLDSLPGRVEIPSGHADLENRKVGLLESLSELFITHPLHTNRFRLLNEFHGSEEFLKARRKIERRQALLKALVPKCRLCGADKPTAELVHRVRMNSNSRLMWSGGSPRCCKANVKHDSRHSLRAAIVVFPRTTPSPLYTDS